MVATYALSGLLIESEVPLETLAPAVAPLASSPRIRFRLAAHRAEPEDGWLASQTQEGQAEPWFSVAKTGVSYLLRWHGVADFVVDPSRDEIACWPEPGCAMGLVEHILADQVLPQLLHLRGQPAFHASAVICHDDAVVAFVGASGSGKSTLAASLGSPSGLVADDCLAVSLDTPQVTAYPSYPSVRLLPDSVQALATPSSALSGVPCADKLRIPVRTRAGQLELRRFYVLERTDQPAPEIERASGRDALIELTKYLYRLDPKDRDRLERDLDMMIELVRRVPVSRLRFRHRYEDLPAVGEAVLADCARD